MSSEKTTKLGLNKWVPDDYVKLDEFNENFDILDEQLAETMNRNKQYQGDLLELLLRRSTLNDNVLVRYVAPNSMDIAVFYKKDEATIFTFTPDNNGWYRLMGAVTRQMTIYPDKETINRDSTTGTWVTTAPNHYTTEVGATFTGSFYGTGCFLQTYANNQGGIWEIVVDGVYTKTISTWSTTAISTKVHPLFENLPEGTHTIVGTFKGDDPDHVPSGGAGTSRGWLRYGSTTTDKGIGRYYTHYVQGNGLVTACESASRKEFAFLCAPTNIQSQRVWVPEHDGSSVLRNIVTKIKFDDREVTLTNESSFYQPYKKVTISSEFDAYNPNDDTSPLFHGRLDQVIDNKGVHVSGHYNFLRDTFISSGYTGMMMIAKGSTRNNIVVDSYGKRYDLDYTINDGTDVVIDNDPFCIMHFVNPATLPADIQAGLPTDARDTVEVIKIDNYMTTMRVEKDNRGPVFVELRTDGNRKTYYQAYQDHTALTGEILDFAVSYFVGKIDEPTKILANSQ